MATNYAPRIVTDGLILCLDAACKRSYPRSGTSWKDLVGSNNATLTNGPTFGDDKGGSFTFDGTDDYVDFTISNLSDPNTIEMFCKLPADINSKMMFGFLRYDVFCFENAMGFNTSNGDIYGLSSGLVDNLNLKDNWNHYVFEMNASVSYTNNKIYVNGVEQSLGQQRGTEISSYRNFNSGVGRIATWTRSSWATYVMDMQLGYFRVYNRALSSDEIRQNYNSAKGRFV